MCIVKTPKVSAGSEKPKEPTVIRNPYLDGVDPATRALRSGRSGFRIERSVADPSNYTSAKIARAI